MKGIVLAGGKGSRLHPITLEIPKPLIPVRKKPLINYNLGLFALYGIDDVKIIIPSSHRVDYARWQREYKIAFPLMTIELLEEAEPTGTLGYLFNYLRGWMGDADILVTNGDDIKNIDLTAMRDFHTEGGFSATIALMNMEHPDDYGAVVVKENTVIDFLEKKAGLHSTLVSAGMYLFSAAAFDGIAPGRRGSKVLMFEKDMFPFLAHEKKLGAFVCEGTFYDCGTLERWERAIREV